MKLLIIEDEKNGIHHIVDYLRTTGVTVSLTEFQAESMSGKAKKRSRIIVKKGQDFHMIRMEDIAYFFTENKVVFVVDQNGKKYLAEINTLSELDGSLDESIFFRANRKYIINANYITRYSSADKSKISIELSVPVHEEITISQENAPVFKKWISEV